MPETKDAIVVNTEWPTVCSEKYCFSVEIADEPSELQHWLMGRKELSAGSGMLFVFPREGTWQFWMKDTLIPLDMLWIGSGGVVTHIAEQVPPCLADPCPAYGPSTGAALYVLEIASGMVKQSGIEVWKELKIKR